MFMRVTMLCPCMLTCGLPFVWFVLRHSHRVGRPRLGERRHSGKRGASSSFDDNHDEENLIQLDEDDEELKGDAILQALTFPSQDVINIDEKDKDNTNSCADYVEEIYYYLNALEKKNRISPTFLERKIVSARNRSTLIDWIIQVHMKFRLLNETLYLSVQVVDAYLEVLFSFCFVILKV